MKECLNIRIKHKTFKYRLLTRGERDGKTIAWTRV